MGLENLKSIFTEGLPGPVDFHADENARVGDKFASGFTLDAGFRPLETNFNIEGGKIAGFYPILDSVQESPTYTTPTLDTFQTSPLSGFDITTFIDNNFNQTDLALTYTDQTEQGIIPSLGSMETLGISDNQNWSKIYNSDHTPKDDVGYLYGPNVSRGNLNMRYEPQGVAEYGFERNNGGIKEPYHVTKIGDREANRGHRYSSLNIAARDSQRITKFLSSDEGLAFIGRQNLLGFSTKVIYRHGDALASGRQRFRSQYNPFSSVSAASSHILGGQPNILFGRTEPNLELLGLPLEALSRDRYSDRDLKDTILEGAAEFVGSSAVTNPTSTQDQQIKTFTQGVKAAKGKLLDKIGDEIKKKLKQAVGMPVVLKDKSSGGDVMTLQDLISGEELNNSGIFTITQDAPAKKGFAKRIGKQIESQIKSKVNNATGINIFPTQGTDNIERRDNGMPFYFKDLRDDTYVIFRAYIEGLTENVNPSWNSTNYIVRSEPVYTYQSTEREINFTLKLFANTEDELDMIYKKMNKLTSMSYPEYKEDVLFKPTSTETGVGSAIGDAVSDAASNAASSITQGASGVLGGTDGSDGSGLFRMKPPFVKLRIGELYGSENSEILGFIKTTSYSIPSESPWETKEGKRVPKYIQVTLGFQVIHGNVPSLSHAQSESHGEKFYGIAQSEVKTSILDKVTSKIP